MLALKLALVATTVWLSSIAARRYGHAVGGVLSGLPMIAAPIMALLLVDLNAEATRAVAVATLVCFPGTVAHVVAYAWAARRWRWPACLACALVAYFGVATLMSRAPWGEAGTIAAALVAPALGLAILPATTSARSPVQIPRIELVLRIAFAVAMAAAIFHTAGAVSAALSGLLLAVPITGSVLPCFTLQRHGADAAIALLRGFGAGLHGFAAFFIALSLGLPALGGAVAFVLALVAAGATASAVDTFMARRTPQTPAGR